MLWHKYRQTYDGAASEVDDVVDSDHLQVQHHLLRPFDRPWQDQGGTHITSLLQRREENRKTSEVRNRVVKTNKPHSQKCGSLTKKALKMCNLIVYSNEIICLLQVI